GSAVLEGVTGLRVDGENVAEIAEALEYLLSDPEESARMGHAARQRVLADFIHKRRVDQLRDLAMKGR
ncbi:MAG: glycosyltransferase, partial [Pseudomonadota bacterium]|nr:glycosyltransferase [Pseudomonadota bacterium]